MSRPCRDQIPPTAAAQPLRTALETAERRGLLTCPATKRVTVTIPAALFDAAAEQLGTTSPTAVIEAALAGVAALAPEPPKPDEPPRETLNQWLAAHLGVLADMDPEFLKQLEM
jgi:hypothetical protein